MIAPSMNFPKESSSTIAASSIHGIGAQKLAKALANGCRVVSGTEFGPNFSNRRRASSPVRPVKSGASLTGNCEGVVSSMSTCDLLSSR